MRASLPGSEASGFAAAPFMVYGRERPRETVMTQETMTCPETGRPLRRDVRPMTLAFEGFSTTVMMPGWYPDGEGGSVHSGEDARVSDAALAELRRRAGEGR